MFTNRAARPLYFLLLYSFVVLANEVVAADRDAKFTDEQIEFFEKDIRPLLIRRCYSCHGPDAKELKGGLRMVTRASLIKGGDTGAAIIPGDAKKSLLIDAINYGEVYQMPPKTKLPASEIALLTKWVTEVQRPSTPVADLHSHELRRVDYSGEL